MSNERPNYYCTVFCTVSVHLSAHIHIHCSACRYLAAYAHSSKLPQNLVKCSYCASETTLTSAANHSYCGEVRGGGGGGGGLGTRL